MSEGLSSSKKVILISPDELDKIPTDSIYVLDTSSGGKHKPSNQSHISTMPNITPASTGTLSNIPVITTQPFTPMNIPPPLSNGFVTPVPYPFPYMPYVPVPRLPYMPYNTHLPFAFNMPPPPIMAPFPSQPMTNLSKKISSEPTTLSAKFNQRRSPLPRREIDQETRKSLPETSTTFYTRVAMDSPPDYFFMDSELGCYRATKLLTNLEDRFEHQVLGRQKRAIANQPERQPLDRTASYDTPVSEATTTMSSSNCSNEPSADLDQSQLDSVNQSGGGKRRHKRPQDDNQTATMPGWLKRKREIDYKIAHPNRLHCAIWHNERGEFNDGPACSCPDKYRIGPLHCQYEGEQRISPCDPESNNRTRLFHYRVIVNPTKNFVQPVPTTIAYNDRQYAFEGYSLFLHFKLESLPPCQILRFNNLYDLTPVDEDFPDAFTVRSLDLLTSYVFTELLELLDLTWKPGSEDGCPVVHLLPRFVHVSDSPDVGHLLSPTVILSYLLEQATLPLFDSIDLSRIHKLSQSDWSDHISPLRGTIATFPGKKPSAIRIDQLDRASLDHQSDDGSVLIYPMIIHMTFTPMKFSSTREPKYKSVMKNFMRLQYLMANKPRISQDDRAQYASLVNSLEKMEHAGVHRREVTVEVSSEGFFRTGIRPDVCQFALNIVSLVAHIRFHKSLESLEARLGYQFKDKSLLHQALTHPSYRRTNFGTNQDHFNNSLVSCGPRNLDYGDKLNLFKQWRKKGLTKMIQVMSFMPNQNEERSSIYGNERLEFLGDAVIEAITSIHLFFMFPEMPEGSLDAFRQAIVQNQHLAELAIRLGLHRYLLYTHSVDFCYDSTFIYARSDAFEALMAAIALDGDLDVVDRIFGAVLFGDCTEIHKVWITLPLHPLQHTSPEVNDQWNQRFTFLQKLSELESKLGIVFQHRRLLARSMNIRKTGFNFVTLGNNQRLEFLGDSLLKYVSTDYLFRHFPRHHEGHLSLLKNSLVNKYTQADVCSDMGLENYVFLLNNSSSSSQPTGSSSTLANHNVKYRADILEAFIGALFVDKDLTWVERFCQVVFWPRLVEFILTQEWNDAKSKLQQCCLTLRSLNESPEIAHYRIVKSSGPTNARMYQVAVYFRGKQLGIGQGRSVQQGQMEAAKNALEQNFGEFCQLRFQRDMINRRYTQDNIDDTLNRRREWNQELVDCFVDKPVSSNQGNSVSKVSPPQSSVPNSISRSGFSLATISCKRKLTTNSTSSLDKKTDGEKEEVKRAPVKPVHTDVKRSKLVEVTSSVDEALIATEQSVIASLASTANTNMLSDHEEGEIVDDSDDDDCASSSSSDSPLRGRPDGGRSSDHRSSSNRRQPSGTLADLLSKRPSK